MTTRLLRRAPLLAALLTCAGLMWATRAELVVSREPLNDHALHQPLAERLAEAMRSGEDPFDAWVSQWTLGHPVPRTYQPLGLLVVAALQVALPDADPKTVFLLVHWIVLGLFPLSVFAGARLIGLAPWRAACCSLVAPLLSTDLLFGLELGSYCWRGSGLFTQEWAQLLLPLALGLGWRAIRGGGRVTPAALLLTLVFAAHFVYGLMGALSLLLAAILPRLASGRDAGSGPDAGADAGATPRASARLVRLAMLGALTFALSAWLLVPLALDHEWVNHSRWEAAWKWDSLGPQKLARLLVTGQFLDFGQYASGTPRFPAITLLALLGAVAAGVAIVRRRARDAETFALAGSALWLLLTAGRGAWDGLYDLLGMSDVPLHRLVGGAHLFLILLAGLGLATLGESVRRLFASTERAAPWARPVSAALAALVVLLAAAPAVTERLQWLKVNESWGRETIALTDRERQDIEGAVELCAARGGRAYAGSAGGWGKNFGVKWTPFYAFLSWRRVPSVSFLYHAMALTSDVMVRFDENDAAQWRVFGVRTAVAPPDRALPAFCAEIARFGRFVVYDAPGGGLFDVVTVTHAARCDRASFYDVVDPWLSSEGPAQRRCIALDLAGRFPEPGFPDRPADERLPPGAAFEGGDVVSESARGEIYSSVVTIESDAAWVVLKMTWHPSWRALVDGVAAPTSHVTPGYIAVRVPPGRHEVTFRYVPGRLKRALLLAAPLVLAIAWSLERVRLPARAESLAAPRLARAARAAWSRRRVREALGILGLALLAGMPLLLGSLPSGHDAMAYPARVVEMDESLRAGIVLPRWAADLSAGHGQPFFLYTPPLTTWLQWPVFALTGDLARALALPAFALLLLGTWAMRRAALAVASPSAAWVAAAAFAMAPYVLLDLHVRAALTEWTGLALAPLLLLALLRHARDGGARWLALAALATALVGFAHHATSLLLVPAGCALAAFHGARARSVRVALAQIGAIALGVIASAAAWMPGLLESGLVHLDKAREGYFHWSEHLVQPWQLVWSRWGHGLSQAGTGDGMSFRLGPVHLLLAAIAGACAVDAARAARGDAARGSRLQLTAMLLGGVVLLSFVMTPWSAPLWRVLPLIGSIQFPWRIAGLVTLLLCLLAALASDGLRERVPPALARFVPVTLVALLVVAGYPLARPAARSALDPLAWTPEEIARRVASTTSLEELEPRAVVERAPYSPELATVASGDATVSATRATPERWRIAASARAPSVVVLRLHDFAGWTLSSGDGGGDGATKLEPEPATGRVRLRLEPGTHDLTLTLERTRVQRAGIALSALGLAGIAALALLAFTVNRPDSGPPRSVLYRPDEGV